MSNNPIQYTSRTYQTILNDINSDKELADKPEWFKRLIAGLGDTMSMIIDAQANNNYLETAFTRDAVRKLCNLIGYRLTPAQTSVGTLKFYLKKDTQFPITIQASDLSATTGSVTSQRFESRVPITVSLTQIAVDLSLTPIENNTIPIDKLETYDKVILSGTVPDGLKTDVEYYIIKNSIGIQFASSITNINNNVPMSISGDGVFTIKLLSFNSTCYQQESKNQINIGQSDGNTQWQEFDLSDKNVLEDTLVVTINDELWTRVDNFGESDNYSKHYMLEYDNKGNSKIIFGNDVYGAIPSNFPIIVTYAVGGGVNSNISKLNTITNYAGNNQYISGVINSSTFNGGADVESMQSAKMIAPSQLKTRDRFVTIVDGENLIYRYGGISLTKIVSNKFGLLSCQVLCVANGGGNPIPSVQQDLQNYLIERSVLGSLDVRVQDTTFLPQSLTINLNVANGYNFNNVKSYVETCCKLFFTECGTEIVEKYKDAGIAESIRLVNSIFDTDYEVNDPQIVRMIEYIVNYGTRNYGTTIYEVDLVSMIKTCVNGINYLTNSEIFPITFEDNEISTIGTYTILEV